MNQKELINITHEIADRLEKQATENYNKQVEEAKAYCSGYIQGVEDYIRALKSDIYKNQTNGNVTKGGVIYE